MTSIKKILAAGRPWTVPVGKLTDAQRKARDEAHADRQARQAAREAKARAAACQLTSKNESGAA